MFIRYGVLGSILKDPRFLACFVLLIGGRYVVSWMLEDELESATERAWENTRVERSGAAKFDPNARHEGAFYREKEEPSWIGHNTPLLAAAGGGGLVFLLIGVGAWIVLRPGSEDSDAEAAVESD